MADSISLSIELALQRVLQLTQAPDELPSAGAVEIVDGNATEPAASAFTERLRTRANELATEIEKVRQSVAESADALAQAAQALQDTDTFSSSIAQQALSVVESAGQTSADTASAPTTGGAAGVRAVLPGAPQ
ncbi:hypothetical protein [Microbacterium sp.]|uniref:hypothetical protein n=1 Tax=Microbacterium sp. TaxID=51671 RepID=UPI00391D19C3